MPRDYWTPRRVQLRRAEAAAVLVRIQKGLDHLGRDVVAVELVELVEPELPASEVQVVLGRVARVASQVSEVLHQDERTALLAPVQLAVLSDLPQDRRAARDRVVRRQLV